MTHTYTVLGEGLLSGETSRSLALAGVRVKSRAQRNGIGVEVRARSELK